jgi:hypothetical protein
MLCGEIITVCSQNPKHINTRRGQNVEFVNFKSGGTYSDHWSLKGYYWPPLFRSLSFPVLSFDAVDPLEQFLNCMILIDVSVNEVAQAMSHLVFGRQ